jgi:hypothetical protein
MNRGLLALLALLAVAACHSEPPPGETNPGDGSGQSLDEVAIRNAMEGVWLFAQRDRPFAGGRFDGIRFDATGRWQTLDVLEDGTVKPAQGAVVGSTSFTPLGARVQTNLHLDSGAGIPLHVELSADGQRMSWGTNMEPWDYQLERSAAQLSEPIPPPPFAPKSAAEALAAVQGVWLFTQPDVTIAGAQCDGLRFDAGGRFELLDVDASGKVVPAQAATTGQVSFSLFNPNASTLQVNLNFDTGGGFPVRSGWNFGGEQMTWMLYMGPVVTLRRTDASVEGTVPPAPYVPTTMAEGLAAAEGVWLFPRRDMALGGASADGIRFNAQGRWELLDVLDDGTVVPAQQALSGLTSFVLPAGLTVQMNLHVDSGGGIGMHTSWTLNGQRMSWLGHSWNGFLKRSDAVVSAPFPPLPYVPRTHAEGLAVLEGVWLFSEPDKSFGGTVCDGVRFDATGRWQTLDVLENGSVVPSTHARMGSTSFSINGTETTNIQLNLHRDHGGTMLSRAGWNGARDRLSLRIDIFSFELTRSNAVIPEPVPGPPFVPATPAEAFAVLEGTWLFSERDTLFGETVCDGVRFDAAGHWQTLDLLADGSVVVAPGGQAGTTSFPFSGPTGLTVPLYLHPTPNSGYGMHANWSQDRASMSWAHPGGAFVLHRIQAEVSGP